MYYVYILYPVDFDRYYVGQCEDIALRIKRHNGRGVPSTKAYVPWNLVYSETFNSRTQAVHRETAIKKKKSRKYIEYLIGGTDKNILI
jgi:putative endonuclease